jgi:hypothetical protein
MKICSFTNYELNARTDPNAARFCAGPTPGERAVQILLLALETVNRAGLDGKKLSNLRLVETYSPRLDYDAQVVEIHAKVEHRLKTRAPAPVSE